MPRLQDVILSGDRASQPAAGDVSVGSLYFVEDEGVIERSDGSTWNAYSGTVDQLLDSIGAAAHGDILYRDSAAWALLAAGTDGDILTTHGAGADPTWETPSGGGDVLRVRVQLTDAQIKTNSSVPVEIIPAPAAGIMINPLSVNTIKQTTAGVYSANPNFSLRYNGIATDLNTAVSLNIASADKRGHRFPLISMTTLQIFTPPPTATSIVFRGTGDVTGGNAANYLVVDVTYELVTDGP